MYQRRANSSDTRGGTVIVATAVRIREPASLNSRKPIGTGLEQGSRDRPLSLTERYFLRVGTTIVADKATVYGIQRDNATFRNACAILRVAIFICLKNNVVVVDLSNRWIGLQLRSSFIPSNGWIVEAVKDVIIQVK